MKASGAEFYASGAWTPDVRGMARGRVPLERALSKLGILSRAEARRCLLAGRVAVAGAVALDPHLPVVPERAALELDELAPGALRVLDAAEMRRAFGPSVPLGRGPVGAWHAGC
jgi:hypothetical protein